MSRVSAKGPLGQKVERQGKDPAHMAKVAQLPCVICHEFGMQQRSRTAVHHCIHGRYGTRKAPDAMTIPICDGHHQGLVDTSKLAIHQRPSEWRRLYGEDVSWLSWVEERI